MLRTLQTNMTGGAISADAKDRLDLAVWKNAVRRAENVSIKPQGGASLRSGMAVVNALPTMSAAYQIEPFVFSQAQSYVCVFWAANVDIYNRITRQFVIRLNGPWTNAQVAANELVVVQSFDTMFVFHKDFETRQISRTGAASFTITTIQWGLLEIDGQKLPRMPMQKFISGDVTLQSAAVTGAGITVTCNGGMFTPDHVGTYLMMYQVVLFVTAYISATQLTVTIFGTLPDTNPTLDWQEQAFSQVHGWARCGILHEQRLWIGGGRDVPNTIWGSTSYDPLNFWLGTGQPTDAIKYVAYQDRVAEIKRMVSFRHLQVFTADGEFFAPSPQQGVLMPSNFSLKQQSAYGIANAGAYRFDQTTIFISRAANAIREFVYDDLQQSYSADALSFMAKDLLTGPVDLDVAIETETAQEALCLVLNADGTLAVLAKVRRENVGGWMLWRTPSPYGGGFKSIGVVAREIWAVVEHNVPGERLLAVFDQNYHTDFGAKLVSGTPATSWGPFPLHASLTVDMLSGDLYLGQATVSAGGYVTTPVAVTELEIGYTYRALIQPLVQEVQLPDGVSWGLPKRNVSVTVSLVDTLTLAINNSLLPTSNAVEDPAVAPDRYTGQFKSWLLGVGVDQPLYITSVLPLPFHLTVIQTEVEV